MVEKLRDILRNHVKHKNIIIVISLICITLLGFIFIFFTKIIPISESKSYDIYYNEDDSGDAKQVSDGNLIKQDFNFSKNMSGFNIYFKVQQAETSGKVKVSLSDVESGKLIEEWDINDSDIKNEEYHQFILKNVVVNKEDTKFEISITSDYVGNENTPSVKVSSRDTYQNGELFVNNESQDSDICFSVSTDKSQFIKYIYLALTVVLTTFVGVLFYLILLKQCRIEKLFVVSALFIGLTYMFLITPYSISDESKHINTAYRYSNIFTFNGGYETEDGNMLKRVSDTEVYGLRTTPSISTYYVVLSHLFDRDNNNEMVETPGERVGNICQYIPSSFGITIARIFKMGYIPLIYLARICNFAFFVTIAYFSIKKAPFGKLVFFMAAMLPMTLQQAASCSYDAIVNGVAFFFISNCLYVAFTDKKIKVKDIIILFILGGLFTAAKAGVYIFVCLLIFIIPKNKFENLKGYIISVGGIIGASVSTLLYFNNVKVTKAVTISSKELVDFNSKVAYPFSYIFHSPLTFIKIICNTIVAEGDFYLSTLIGGDLGWYTIPVPVTIVIGYIILMIFSAFRKDEEKQYLSMNIKFIMGTIIAIIFIAFQMVALTWTPYGNKIILGVEGRYFLPISPLIILLFRNNSIVTKKSIDKLIIGATGSLQVITLLSVFVTVISG